MAYRFAAVVGGIGFTCGLVEVWRRGARVSCVQSDRGKSLLWMEQGERTVWNRNWDCREGTRRNTDEKEEVNKPTATRHLILVRHGQYQLGEKEAEKKVAYSSNNL